MQFDKIQYCNHNERIQHNSEFNSTGDPNLAGTYTWYKAHTHGIRHIHMLSVSRGKVAAL